MVPIAVLISGQGTNLHHIYQWCQAGKIGARIVGVISDKPSAAGLEWARQKGLSTACIEYANKEKDRGEDEIDQQLRQWGAEFIVLAGYMRILQDSFISRWPDALINLHPSLLPLYKGIKPYERALADGQSHHGCSVHMVIEELDAGQVIAQAKLAIAADDTVASLSERVRALEHQLLPRVLRLICNKDIKIHRGVATYKNNAIDSPLMLDELQAGDSVAQPGENASQANALPAAEGAG
ncbi:MAG: phosphoribosylglycinamide formyltransferase [Gammaproteobacteria bacterium]|nr:phosphoribosylglycinamide formyltransferase [Gammaproteobacteria bacterium]